MLGLVGWELAVKAFGIQKFLLPKPSEILSAFWDQRHILWPAGWYTFTEAFWGFVDRLLFGIAAALVLARFRAVGSALMPYFIAASAIPIIAFAPIANAWFGIEKGSKIFIAALLCFFPVLVNTLRGLTSVRPQQVELMRSYAAGNLAVFRRVRIPTSLPYVFAALKIASVLAMIGAIVGSTSAARSSSSGSRSRTRPRSSSSRRPGQRSSWLVFSASVSTWPCRWRRC